jgi:hypothetical protein
MDDQCIFNGYVDRGNRGVFDIQVYKYAEEAEGEYPFFIYYNDGDEDDLRYDRKEFKSAWGNRFFKTLDDYKANQNVMTANEVLDGVAE